MKSKTDKRISISIVISIVSLLFSILLTFVFNRFLLDQPQIGDVNYGLKSTVDSLTSFVSIFVLGMSSTFIRFHRKYENDEKSLFSSFNIVILSIAGFALLFGVVLVILSANNIILNTNNGMYSQKQVHDFIVILIVSLMYLLLSIGLSCNKWYLESVKSIIFVRVINLICIILYPVISIIFVLNGADMIGVTIIYSIVYLCGFTSYLIYRLVKTKFNNPFVIKGFKKEIIKEILFFSFFVVIASFIETFNHSVDKVILTIGFGAAYTTLYQLSMSINQVLLSLCDTLYAPYVPYISDDAKDNDVQSTQKTYNKVSFILLLLSFTLIIGFFACGKDFVILWLGEGRVDVYYYALVIFLAWPVYGIAKFSLQIHRAYNKHYLSALLFIASFIIHLIVTFSLVWVIGVWACIVGTAVSMLFLGVSFIIYNKAKLSLEQKSTIYNIFKFCISALITCAIMFLFNHLIDKYLASSHLVLLLAKGFISIVVWCICLVAFFFRQVKKLYGKMFINVFDSSGNIIQESFYSKLKRKLQKKKEKINNLFSVVLIIYFVFNFASYYLGGIEPIKNIVSNSVFEYGTKFISYILIITYCIAFYISNNCSRNKIGTLLVFLTMVACIVSAFVVPKEISIQLANKYNFIIELHFTAGFFDILIGIVNYAIDLFVMMFFVYYLRTAITYKQARLFLLFVIAFGVIECIYSFIFDFSDYQYFFQTNPDTSSGFNGYTTNICGTFSSKNGFGFLLFGSFLASAFVFYQQRKWYFVLPGVLIFAVSVFSLCKTALLSIIIFLIFVFAALLIHLKKTSKKGFWSLLLSSIAIIVFFGLIFTPLFRQISIFDKFAGKISSFFFVSGEATTRSRSIIWIQAMQLFKGPFIIFGYGKTVSLNMLSLATNMTTVSYHNVILNTLCCYGIIGLLIYFYNIYYVTTKVIFAVNKKTMVIVLLGIMFSSLMYGMMEVTTLFISSSSVLIVSNVLLTLHKEDKKTMIGDNTYEEIYI